MKEKVLFIKSTRKPKTRDRQINSQDKFASSRDKKGNVITLEADKKLYPFKLDNTCTFTIETTKRTIKFRVPSGYRWNGADIPKALWVFVGSQYNPEFKIPSMIHDFMLEFKHEIFDKLEDITMPQYRRLTSLIFREALKQQGVRTVKSNIMAGAVQFFQTTLNRKEWR